MRELSTAGQRRIVSTPFEDAKRRLAKAVLLFQDKFVDLQVDSGSLVQVSQTPAFCLFVHQLLAENGRV